MEKPHIIKVLEDAQLAHKSGDFTNALSFYEYFFDHALDDDPYALYSMRLYHCVDGWSRLAKDFVGAKNRLEEKKQETLSLYQKLKRPEHFHDYYAISCGLEQKEEALQQFITIYNANFKSAARLIKFVWNDLVAAEHWQICNAFLDDPVQKLDESFAVFDEACRLRDIDVSFANDDFDQHTLNELVKGASELIHILRHSNRANDVELIERKFYEIAHARDHSGLNKLIQAQGTFLFSGH